MERGEEFKYAVQMGAAELRSGPGRGISTNSPHASIDNAYLLGGIVKIPAGRMRADRSTPSLRRGLCGSPNSDRRWMVYAFRIVGSRHECPLREGTPAGIDIELPAIAEGPVRD